MQKRKSISEITFDTINHFILFLLVIITIYPFLYVLFASLSDPLKVLQGGSLLLWPHGFNLDAYKMVFKNPMVMIGYRNTIIYVVTGTAINMLLTSFGAYVLSRRDLYGKSFFMFLIVFTMFFSGGLIPLYLLVNKLNMTNTVWAMVIPGAISTWNLIIMRTSFVSMPESLVESAKMDGANDFYVLFKIILPLSLPIISVMILFYGVSHWNSWFNAMIFLRKRELYPLQLVLREILISNSTDSMTIGITGDVAPVAENIKYATVMVATIPILLIYPFLQKYFVKGVMIGAIKE
ncbi:MAG: carbohydrate ABC transporter permease [Firmicutes bacterium]|nr:carbohydrate ABC transporter permease [Bacillota bacterium]